MVSLVAVGWRPGEAFPTGHDLLAARDPETAANLDVVLTSGRTALEDLHRLLTWAHTSGVELRDLEAGGVTRRSARQASGSA